MTTHRLDDSLPHAFWENARSAICYMIDHLAAEYGLRSEQAYCLCGAAVDLKLSEIGDEPNWRVSAYLPVGIFA